MKRIREHLTFANGIAVIALFVALGGSAYAATQLPRDSVGSEQLKRGAVTPAKLAKTTTDALIDAEDTTRADPLVVDASSNDFEFSASGTSSVPLSGRTSWTAGPGQVGLLFGRVLVRAGTTSGPHPAPACGFDIRVLDNGTEIAHLGTTALSMEEIRLKLTPEVIAFHEPGNHTITVTASQGSCAAGSKIVSLVLGVAPLG